MKQTIAKIPLYFETVSELLSNTSYISGSNYQLKKHFSPNSPYQKVEIP